MDLPVKESITLLDGGIDTSLSADLDFPVVFQTAWSILLNKLRDTVPESVDLLRLCTFFAPGFIPVRLLKEMPHDQLPEQIAGLLNDPLLWNRAINQLRQYSVVRLESHEAAGDETASSDESLYLHRIVHADMPDEDRSVPTGPVHVPISSRRPEWSEHNSKFLEMRIFDRWDAQGRTVGVRTFESVLSTLRGGPPLTEAMGLAPTDLAVVETDGSFEQADSLKTAYDGAPSTGYDVDRHTFAEFAGHPGVRARQLGLAGVGATCRRCPVIESCGGGLYAHRYSTGRGFANPSVFCADLKALVNDIAS